MTNCAAYLLLALVMLIIIVKGHHLIEHFLSDLVKWGHYVGSNSNLHVAEFPDDWLELVVVNPVERFDNL